MSEQRKYWLKLEDGFFTDVRIRSLQRKCGAGAVYVYLRVMVLSLKSNCCLTFYGTEDTFQEEIAVQIGMETQEGVDLVQAVLEWGLEYGLIDLQEEDTIIFLQAQEMSGNETMAAGRMRKFRAARQEGDEDHEEGERNNVTLQRNESGEMLRHSVTTLLYKNKSKEEIKNSKEELKKRRTDVTSPCGRDVTSVTLLKGEENRTDAHAPEGGAPSGLFTLDECRETAQTGKVPITEEGLMEFFRRNEENGWTINGKPVKNLLLALRGFLKNFQQYKQQAGADPDQEPKKTSAERKQKMTSESTDQEPQGRPAAEIEQSIIAKGAERMPDIVRDYVSRQGHAYQLRAAVWYCKADQFQDDEQSHIKKALKMELRPADDLGLSDKGKYYSEREQCAKNARKEEWDGMSEMERADEARRAYRGVRTEGAPESENIKTVAEVFASVYSLDHKEALQRIREAAGVQTDGI